MNIKHFIKFLILTLLSFSGCALICGKYYEPRSFEWKVKAPTEVGEIMVNHRIHESWSYNLFTFHHWGSLDLIPAKYSYGFTFVDNGEIIEWNNDPEDGSPFILNKYDNAWYTVYYCPGNDSRKIKFYVYKKKKWTEIQKHQFPKKIAMHNLNTWFFQASSFRLSAMLVPERRISSKPEIYKHVYSTILNNYRQDPSALWGILLFHFWDYLESSNDTLDWSKHIPIEDSIKFKERYIK